MRLSKLQKYILLQTYHQRKKLFNRDKLIKFYNKQKSKVKKELWVKNITKSIERMIDKGLLVGYGMRTPKKWFIKEIKLTAIGLKTAKKLIGEQMSLPLRKKKK